MSRCVFIAGGGTGGHVYPALSIAEALKKQDSKVEIHFVGTSRGIENRVVPKAGFNLHLVKVGQFNGVSLFVKLKTLLFLPWAFIQSFLLLIKYKPDVVLGVGGYASLPVVLVAAWMRKKTFIWEPNAYPGLSNRILGPRVDKALLVFEETNEKVNARAYEIVGLPVRSEIEALGQEAYNVAVGKLNILIFGGSQGARGINNAVVEAIKSGGDWLSQVNIVHQIGRFDFEKVKAEYDELGKVPVAFYPYLDDMDKQFKWAHFVVCRSGASTVAELAASGNPSLLVPLPSASDNHQQKNAESLLCKSACWMCLQENFDGDMFIKYVQKALNEPSDLYDMSESIKTFYVPQAAEKIAAVLFS